jgi:hypothetical protein
MSYNYIQISAREKLLYRLEQIYFLIYIYSCLVEVKYTKTLTALFKKHLNVVKQISYFVSFFSNEIR